MKISSFPFSISKSLRGSKMEDIIFSGTQVRKSLGFAEVSLTLDNEDGALPVEYSEVTVTRRVFRSGESEYFINRGACRLKDIVELFMDTGVGKEGYSIIGQGRIDEILSTRSEDRRYIFEEAAGIVKYKTRRDESEKKLERTRENLIRVEDILSELEQQLGPLEEQSRAAKEYLQLKEQLKTYEINQFLYQYSRHNERIEELKEQITQLEEEAESRKKQTGLMESKRDNLYQELNELQAKIDEARNERYDLLNASEKIKGEQNLNRERIRQFQRDNTRLQEEIARKEQDIKDVQESLSILRNTVQEREQAFKLLCSTRHNGYHVYIGRILISLFCIIGFYHSSHHLMGRLTGRKIIKQIRVIVLTIFNPTGATRGNQRKIFTFLQPAFDSMM
jgi:chromosome segregation protein